MAWTIPQRIELGELAELANFREVVKQTVTNDNVVVVVEGWEVRAGAF